MMKKITTLLMLLMTAAYGYSQTDCSELFFSEYIEGGSNNKAVEIYNPTSSSIDLSNYSVILFSNGSTNAGNTIVCKGTLLPGEVYVIAHSSAVQGMKDVADTLSGSLNFNGDDAVVLLNTSTSDTADIIGKVGERLNWTVGTGSTQNHTLVRMSSVKSGTTDWSKADNEWDVYSQDTYTDLGMHTGDCSSSMNTPGDTSMVDVDMVTFVGEGDGTVYLYASVDSIGSEDTVSIQIENATGGNALLGRDYNFSTTILTFTANHLEDSFAVEILEDTDIEGDEIFFLQVSVIKGIAALNTDTILVIIEDNDFALVSIKDLKAKDANGDFVLADSLVRISGVVHGPNFQTSNIEFRVFDGEDAVVVFEFGNEAQWGSINDGDSVDLIGEVGEFRGLTQFRTGYMETLNVVATGKPLMTPMVVDSLYEAIESHLVKMENVTFSSVDAVFGSGGNYWIKTSLGDSVLMRLDADVPAWDWRDSIPERFDIIGFVGQFDIYQITPRYVEDIMPLEPISIAKTKEIEAKIYPNPSKGVFTINAENIQNIKIFNLLGAEIQYIAGNKGNQYVLDMSRYQNGVYLVQFNSEGTTITQKIIKK